MSRASFLHSVPRNDQAKDLEVVQATITLQSLPCQELKTSEME